MKRRSASLVAGLVLFIALPGHGAEEDSADVQARQLFNEGIRLFKDEDFDGASIAFNRAYELRPSYKILYNVGQVESELKHYCRALKAYSEYVEKGGDEIEPARKTDVEAQIKRLEILVGSVEITYEEDGITVFIDEERYGVTPLEGPICIDMGNHALSLRKGVTAIYGESLRIAGGQHLSLNLGGGESPEATLPPVSEPPKETAVEAPAPREQNPTEPESTAQTAPSDTASKQSPPPEKQRPKRKWTWIALGTGAALGVVGGIIGGVALAKQNTLESACNGTECDPSDKGLKDTITTLNLTADILYGAAGACGIAALVLFFVEPRRTGEKAMAVVPGVSTNGVGLTVEGRF